MPSVGAELAQDSHHRVHVTGPVRITGMTGDTYITIFRQRAGDPRLATDLGKSTMRFIVMAVHRIAQRKQ
jgi:hypothetical protein